MFIIRLCRVVAEKMPHVLKRIFEVFHKIFSYTPSVIPDIYMSVKFLAECKKFQKKTIKFLLWAPFVVNLHTFRV